MKRIVIPIVALTLALTGCMLQGKWSFSSSSQGYREVDAKGKPAGKFKVMFKIPGKYRGCAVSAEGYVKFSGNTHGEFTRSANLTIKCPGQKPIVQKALLKAKFKVVKEKGKTYLLIWNRHGKAKVLMKKKLNRLSLIRVQMRPTLSVKDGRLVFRVVQVVAVENYRK